MARVPGLPRGGMTPHLDLEERPPRRLPPKRPSFGTQRADAPVPFRKTLLAPICPGPAQGFFSRSLSAALLGGAAWLFGVSPAVATEGVAGAPLPGVGFGAVVEEHFDPGQLTGYGLFKYFWEPNGDHDLADGGQTEVNRAGAQKLLVYAKTHDLAGAPKADGVSPAERALVAHLVDHPNYEGYFNGLGKVEITRAFGLASSPLSNALGSSPSTSSESDAALLLPGRVSRLDAKQLAGVPAILLASKFSAEYQSRRDELEGADDEKEQSRQVLGLFRDYCLALWANAETPDTENAGRALLEALAETSSGMVLGAQRYSGAPWSAAQGMVLGLLDPTVFPTAFPLVPSGEGVTFMDLDGSMAEAMAFLDQYRKLQGLPIGAEAFEGKNNLGHLIGEPSGHVRYGDADERQPFQSTRLNWGAALFPGDPEVKALPPSPDLEFPIDFIDGRGLMVGAVPAFGEKLVVRDRQGHPVRVEKEIVRNSSGKPVAWTAHFSDQRGRRLSGSDLLAVIVDQMGQIKGDGQASQRINLDWTGFCERMAAAQVIKLRYDLPELDRSEIKVAVRGQTLTIPKVQAQALLDTGMMDLAAAYEFRGFRFDGEPATILLDDGKTYQEFLNEGTFLPEHRGARIGGDMVKRTIEDRDGARTVLAPGDEDEHQGDFVLGGVKVSAQHLSQVTGETPSDLRPSIYLAWIIAQNGVFASDSILTLPVSNDIRWVNQVEQWRQTGGAAPAWVPQGEIMGIQGPLTRQDEDQVTWLRGLYKTNRDGDLEAQAFILWVQTDENGLIINEGFRKGRPDFTWAPVGALDWSRPSGFTPFDVPELRLALLVNGLDRSGEEMESIAARLNFPPHWRTLRTEQD